MQLLLSGSIVAGPPQGSDNFFPGSGVSIPLALTTTPRTFQVGGSTLSRTLTSSSSFVTLSGLGPNDTVTRGIFLYLRSNAPVTMRITTDDGTGGSVVESGVAVSGLLVREFSDAKFLKLLEAEGTATVEYFVCGNQ